MMTQPPKTDMASPGAADRLAAETTMRASTLVAALELGEAALGLLEAETKPRQYINTLAEKGLYADAIKVMAAALDKAAAVRWGLACVQADGAPTKAKSDAVCRAAVEAWLAEPSEKNRRLAMNLSETSGLTSAYHWLAAATGWSGGSLAPAEFDEVRPPEHLTAVAVACAIRLAAQTDPEKYEARLFAFLKLGARFAVAQDPGRKA